MQLGPNSRAALVLKEAAAVRSEGAGPRLAIVTGVTRAKGIGRAIVEALLCRPEWRVCGVDLWSPEWQPPEAAAARHAHVIADLSTSEGSEAVVRTALERFGEECSQTIAFLVNNAGISDPFVGGTGSGKAEDVLCRDFRRVIDSNLTSAFLMSRAVDGRLASGACIIHISSTRARMSEPGTEAYAAAKAGLIGLMHAQAVSLAGRARVNCVLPGYINTADEEPTEDGHAFHLAGRVGIPSDVADTCLFLLDQGFMTGAEIVVDGGVTRKMIYPE